MIKLATLALSIAPTSGSAEQNWSTFGFIHSKSRNRLTNERVGKLVYIYWNQRIKKELRGELTPDVLEAWEELAGQAGQGEEGEGRNEGDSGSEDRNEGDSDSEGEGEGEETGTQAEADEV